MCKGKPKEVPIPPLSATTVGDVLPLIYQKKVVPMEKRHLFDDFYTPSLQKSEFSASPIVLFLGQYSVGKTSMIKYITGKEYPGSMIGPEPTTDCFTVVFYSDNPHEEMGASLLSNPNLPFKSLEQFGGAFENRLRGAAVDAPVLRHMTFIDTPGILAGDKQVKARNYDFSKIIRFLADKVDMIICVFDTTKLDMSDEFKDVLKSLNGNDEKVKIVLNKADCVSPSELVRVRGALMWGLSKIIITPEVPKVYIGSFTEEMKNPNVMSVFKADYFELFNELEATPNRSLSRKVNDVIKRAKRVRLHAHIMTELMKLKGASGGINPPKNTLKPAIVRTAFSNVQRNLGITDHDMPNANEFIDKGLHTQAKHWKKIDPKVLALLDEFISKDIPQILGLLPHDDKNSDSVKEAFCRLRDIVENAGSSPHKNSGEKKSEDKKSEEKKSEEKSKSREKSEDKKVKSSKKNKSEKSKKDKSVKSKKDKSEKSKKDKSEKSMKDTSEKSKKDKSAKSKKGKSEKSKKDKSKKSKDKSKKSKTKSKDSVEKKKKSSKKSKKSKKSKNSDVTKSKDDKKKDGDKKKEDKSDVKEDKDKSEKKEDKS